MKIMMKPKPCCPTMGKAMGDIIQFNTEDGVFFSTDGDPSEFDYPRLHCCPWCGERIEYEGEK